VLVFHPTPHRHSESGKEIVDITNPLPHMKKMPKERDSGKNAWQVRLSTEKKRNDNPF
jgi:hypothetical protein